MVFLVYVDIGVIDWGEYDSLVFGIEVVEMCLVEVCIVEFENWFISLECCWEVVLVV